MAIGCVLCCRRSAAELNWLTDVPKAQAQAKTGKQTGAAGFHRLGLVRLVHEV